MSCNGCRVLRRGCGESCVLRPCLDWIQTPQGQGNATLFLSKFFGRTDLFNFITAVSDNNRPALFRSLLFEACGRTINPVSGAVGLLSTGNWHLCQIAVQTILDGGILRPSFTGDFADASFYSFGGINFTNRKETIMESSDTEESEMVVSFGTIGERANCEEPKLLNLFV